VLLRVEQPRIPKRRKRMREILAGQLLPAIREDQSRTRPRAVPAWSRRRVLGMALCRYVLQVPPVVGHVPAMS